MGLDMYAYKAKKLMVDVPKFFDSEEAEKYITVPDGNEFFYWRKHPNLHGWFQNLYMDNGGKDVFNCIYIELTLEDLEELEEDLEMRKLPYTVGFCFGQSTLEDKDFERDLDFVKKAKKAIKKGYSVYYTSWW